MKGKLLENYWNITGILLEYYWNITGIYFWNIAALAGTL
jgi:hypothetical protein